MRLNKASLVSTVLIAGSFTLIQLLLLVDIARLGNLMIKNCPKTLLLPNRTLLSSAVVVCFLVFIVVQWWGKQLKLGLFSKEILPPRSSIIIASLLLFGLQVFVADGIYFYSGWDVGTVRDNVYCIIQKLNQPQVDCSAFYKYHSFFPNNINITGILLLIERTFSTLRINHYFIWVAFSALSVNLAGVFTFLTTYKLSGKTGYAMFSWGTFVILVGLSPWITIPYTDTYSILFPILAFYIYVARGRQERNFQSWFWIAFLCFLGYTIKPTVILTLAGIFAIELIQILADSNQQTGLRKVWILIPLAAAVVPVLGLNAFFGNLIGVRIDKELRFSPYHFIMMGLNEKSMGGFSNRDVMFSRSFATAQERNQATLAVIRERLKGFGVSGFANFLSKKAVVNFSDGSFAWSCEGDFYAQIPEPSGKIAVILRDILYAHGAYHALYLTAIQALWFIVLVLTFTLGLTALFKKPDYGAVALMLILIGLTAFVMLFEARARYLFTYSPFFMVAAGLGAQGMANWRVKKRS